MLVYFGRQKNSGATEACLRTYERGLDARFVRYEELPQAPALAYGICVFHNAEGLSPAELRAAADLAEQLSQQPSARILNDPRRLLSNYDFLVELHDRGLN